jgi:hypothetical protein
MAITACGLMRGQMQLACVMPWQGTFPDTNILDISDVELHDLQMFEDDPVIVVKFSCQQIR